MRKNLGRDAPKEVKAMRRKRLLSVATIILLALTVLWGIFFYLHIQAYHRMFQAYEENGKLGNIYGLREPFFAWGNGPILIISGFILIWAWIILITGWRTLKKK